MNNFFQTLLDLVSGDQKITLESLIEEIAKMMEELTKFVEGKLN